MEPGETREPREPGPGAETAAAPRWEEAKTFHDNLAPKKKPKSVKAGHGYGGGQGEGRGRVTGEGVVSPLERDPWCPSEKGRSSSAPECARPLARARVYFWSSAPVFLLSWGSGCTPGPPSLMLSSGPSSRPRPSPSPCGQPGASGRHLLAKPVSGACGSAPGSGNPTLKTRLLAVRSGFCHLGTGLQTRTSAFRV